MTNIEFRKKIVDFYTKLWKTECKGLQYSPLTLLEKFYEWTKDAYVVLYTSSDPRDEGFNTKTTKYKENMYGTKLNKEEIAYAFDTIRELPDNTD